MTDSVDIVRAEAQALYRSAQRLAQAYNDDLPLDQLAEAAVRTHIDYETLSEQERMVWAVVSMSVLHAAMAQFNVFVTAVERDRARRA